MWFGLLHLSPDDGDDVERETAIVVAYEPRRLFRVASSMEGLPSLIATLRQAADHGRKVCEPRCGSCDVQLDVPDLDADAECASA